MGADSVVISPRPHWWGGVAAITGSFTFFLACLLNLAFLSGTAFKTKNPLIAIDPESARQGNLSVSATAQAAAYKKYMMLDKDFLRQLWAYRTESADLAVVTSAVTTLSFLLLLAAVVALADAFEERSGHKASKTLLVPSFLFASALVVLDLTFYAGQMTTSKFIFRFFTLDDETLEGLEISYMMTNSREMWMMGMVWFFLMAGMATAAFLNARSNLLYSSWTFLTVLISMLSFIGFLAEVGRLRWFTASAALDIALAVLVSFVFLPIWMAWTGIFLVAIRAKDFTEVPVSGDAANGRPTRSVPSAVDV